MDYARDLLSPGFLIKVLRDMRSYRSKHIEKISKSLNNCPIKGYASLFPMVAQGGNRMCNCDVSGSAEETGNEAVTGNDTARCRKRNFNWLPQWVLVEQVHSCCCGRRDTRWDPFPK